MHSAAKNTHGPSSSSGSVIQQNDESVNGVNKMLLDGALLRMASNLLSALTDGTNKANGIICNFITNKLNVVDCLVAATTNAGLANSIGQELAGAAGMLGGGLGIVGGGVGVCSALNEFNELRNIGALADDFKVVGQEATIEAGGAVGDPEAVEMDNMQDIVSARGEAAGVDAVPIANPRNADDAVTQLSDEQKAFLQKNIEKKYQTLTTSSQMMMQTLPALMQGFGQLAQSPLTAESAMNQAQSQKAQALSESNSAQMSSTEGVAQGMQSLFGQISNLPSQMVQYRVLLAQAH